MALSKAILKSNMITEIENIGGFTLSNEHCKAEDFIEALANAIVDHITTNAVVVVTVTGVTAGGATAPGVGIVS